MPESTQEQPATESSLRLVLDAHFGGPQHPGPLLPVLDWVATLPAAHRRPRKIIDLDSLPPAHWRFEASAAHLWQGKLWLLESVGCICCVEDNGATLSRVRGDGGEEFHCMTHGVLDEVPYRSVEHYTITIGDVVRDSEDIVNDSMLFPRSKSAESRRDLINKLLDESEDNEGNEDDDEDEDDDGDGVDDNDESGD